MNQAYEVLHSACGRRGDMAIFGDLATYTIFKKKWSCI